MSTRCETNDDGAGPSRRRAVSAKAERMSRVMATRGEYSYSAFIASCAAMSARRASMKFTSLMLVTSNLWQEKCIETPSTVTDTSIEISEPHSARNEDDGDAPKINFESLMFDTLACNFYDRKQRRLFASLRLGVSPSPSIRFRSIK